MNAIELANELKRCIDDGSTDLVCVKEAMELLLQLAKEIEQLKKVLKEIIDISDRKHDAWDKAKVLLKKESEK